MRFSVATVAGMLAAIACAAEPVDPEVVQRSIREPWRAEPISIEPVAVEQANAACRRLQAQLGNEPANTAPLAVVDTRGGSKIVIVYADMRSEMGCIAELGQSGEWITSGTSSSALGMFEPPAPGGVTIESASTTGDGPGAASIVVGRAGSDVAKVVITAAGGRSFRASLSPNGWFAGWWPGDRPDATVQAHDGAGRITGTAP